MTSYCKEWTQPDGDHFHGLCTNGFTPKLGLSKNQTPNGCEVCVSPKLISPPCANNPALFWKIISPIEITGDIPEPVTGTISSFFAPGYPYSAATLNQEYTRTLTVLDPTSLQTGTILVPSINQSTPCRWGYNQTEIIGYQFYPSNNSIFPPHYARPDIPYVPNTFQEKFRYQLSPASHRADGSVRLSQGCLPYETSWVWHNMDELAQGYNGLRLGTPLVGNPSSPKYGYLVQNCWSWYMSIDFGGFLSLGAQGHNFETAHSVLNLTSSVVPPRTISWDSSALEEWSGESRGSAVGGWGNWQFPNGFALWRPISQTPTTITYSFESKSGTFLPYSFPQTVTVEMIVE